MIYCRIFIKVIAGCALTTLTGGIVGSALVGEGIGDIVMGIEAYITGEFSWKNYLINKGISLAVSLVVWGIGKAIKYVVRGVKAVAKGISNLATKACRIFSSSSVYKTSSGFISRMYTSTKSFLQPVINRAIKIGNTLRNCAIRAKKWLTEMYKITANKVRALWVRMSELCCLEMSKTVLNQNCKQVIKTVGLTIGEHVFQQVYFKLKQLEPKI
jgi:hypothetical protein